MCGLAGIFNLDGSPISTKYLASMTQLIKHRGPDDEGFLLINKEKNSFASHSGTDSIDEIRNSLSFLPSESSGSFGMGFRRLSIIDTSAAGHQPMLDPAKNFALCFNGEIYNYLEIKKELEALGHIFQSGSDSEVLLHSYMQWHAACLDRFIGMFAIAIYDLRNNSLFIARDRLGIKPFLYYFDQKRFVWGSEEKQFVFSGILNCSPNHQAISNYLSQHLLFEDQSTFFNEIQQLPSGSYAIINQQGMKIQSYWDIPIPQIQNYLNEPESINTIQRLLKDSIKLRLRSDVPLGIALSGGIDSSSVCCLARTLTNTSINTFSVFYEGEKYDERTYIEEVIKLGGFEAKYHTSSNEQQLSEIEQWIYYQDAPSTSGSPFSAYKNYQNVKDSGIIVLLNGQGGDELFAGYPYFLKYFFAQCMIDRKWLIALRELMYLGKNQGIKTLIAQVYLTLKRSFSSSSVLRNLEFNKYISSDLYPVHDNNAIIEYPDSDYFVNALYRSVRKTHLPHMLRWEDRNSMANSIESRVPFLDHRLVEASFFIPPELKIKNGFQKYILRKSMSGIVPEPILKRTDKIGFGTPTDEWTGSSLHAEIKELLHSNIFLHRPWIKGRAVLNKIETRPDSFGVNELWRIASTELWHRRFFNS